MQAKQEFKYANILFTGTIVFMTLLSVIGVTAIIKTIAGGEDYVKNVTVSQFELIIPAAVYFVFCRRYLKNYECGAAAEVCKRTGIRMIGPVKIVLAVLSAAAFIPFLTFINNLSLVSFSDKTTANALAASAKYPFIVMFILIAVLPALVEEMLFRGIYYHVYKKAGSLIGILVSALFFGLMHSNFNQFAYAFIAGIVFSVFVSLSGSVVYTVIMHILINGTTVFSFYSKDFGLNLPGYFTESHHESVSEVFSYYFLPALIGSFVMVLCVSALFYMKKQAEKAGESAETDTEILKGSFKVRFFGIMDQYFFTGVTIMVLNMIAVEILK